jgi:RimJ/RimL family protein N-acetyltransferase
VSTDERLWVSTGERKAMQETGGVVIRPATERDVEGILAVQEPAAIIGLGHIFPQDEYPFPRATVAQRWRTELTDGVTAVYVSVDVGRKITGFAGRRHDEVLHFGTACESWGSGLAQQLHDALVRTFPASVRRIRLRVFEQNQRARRFYEKLGWVATGVTSRTNMPPCPVLLEYTLTLKR